MNELIKSSRIIHENQEQIISRVSMNRPLTSLICILVKQKQSIYYFPNPDQPLYSKVAEKTGKATEMSFHSKTRLRILLLFRRSAMFQAPGVQLCTLLERLQLRLQLIQQPSTP